MFELLIATRNPGKVREVETVLQSLPLTLRYLDDFPGIPAVIESGVSYEENAILKAKSYASETGLFALADDSGLEVQALAGRPGLHSARYGGERPDPERVALLLNELANVHHEQRQASFVCVIAIASTELLNVSRGTCNGRISEVASRVDGFGFDPIFIPEGYDITFAEMPLALKNQISHRAEALLSARSFLDHWLKQRLL